MHTKTDILSHTQVDNLRASWTLRVKKSVQTDVTVCLPVCLIVRGLMTIRSSMMPVVLLCMTHASVDSRHVDPYASTHKQNTDKKS